MLQPYDVVRAPIFEVNSNELWLFYQEAFIRVWGGSLLWESGELCLNPLSEHFRPGELLRVRLLEFHTREEHNWPQYPEHWIGSVKELYPERNPWRDLTRLQPGSRYSGVISSRTAFGCMVLLPCGVYGFIPRRYEERPYQIGEHVSTQIIHLDHNLQRLTLRPITKP